MQKLYLVLAIFVAIAVFFGWTMLVGPSIHYVETIIGLILSLLGALATWIALSRALRRRT